MSNPPQKPFPLVHKQTSSQAEMDDILPCGSPKRWFFEGTKQLISVPSLILIMSFVGFGGLTSEAGLSVWQAMGITLFTWALPSAVLLAGAIMQDLPLYATIIAVILASIRLLPMTIALMPLLRTEKTRLGTLLFSAHFVAVTTWVLTMRAVPEIPRQGRMPFFLGVGSGLLITSTIATGLANVMTPDLPPILAAGLLFLTPVYFLLSMLHAAQGCIDYAAVGFGLVLAPVFHFIAPETDLLWAGLLGGSLSYGLGRLVVGNNRRVW